MRTNKKISIFLTFIMLISIFSINFPSINVAASDESKVVFELSEDIAKDDGTQVELTLTVYNMKFKLMDFALGFDNTKVQLANKNTNAVSTTPAAVMTVLAKAFAENEETFEYEGWYVATKPVINNDYGNNTGAIWFGFYADDDSKGKVDGSNAEGYVEAGAEGLKVLKLHFRKLGNIDENTFKILTATDTGGNAATPSGLFLATDEGELTDPKYIVLPGSTSPEPSPEPITESKVVFELSEDIAKDDGTQVELTLTVYNMKFKLMDFALGFDNTKVQLANKNTNAVSTTPAAVMTVLAKAFAENEETFEYEGWYVATKPVINNDYGNNTGAIWFGFYADDDSKGKVDGSNAEGYVEAGAEGLKVLKLHFRKLGNIDENTFKILTATDTGGNAATPSGLFLATDKGELTDSKYVVLPYQDENPTPTPVDKAPLAAKIAEAEDLLEAAEVGTAPGQYPEEAYNTFEAAINAAKAVNDDEDATQAEVDAAVEALEDAIAAFEASVIGELPVNKDALAAKIAEAEDLLEAAEVGTAPGQYPEEAYNTFEAAINAAKAVNDDEDATQAEVDAAVEALEDAIAAFEASVIGELPVNKDALAAKIAEAEDLLEAAEVGTAPGQYPEEAYNTFEAAINAAKAVNDDEDATQAEVDAAVEALEDAIAAFAAAEIEAPEVDKSALAAKIAEAKVLKESAEVGEEPGQYPEEAYNTFAAAIDAAEAVYDKADATQAEVDNAVAALEDAIAAFEASVIGELPVNKDALAAKIAEAEDLLEAAEVGTAPGQYPEEAYNTFEAAINAAKAVNDDEDATQAEVDAAVEALEDAIAAFEASVIEAPPVDKSELAAKIAEAEDLLEAAEVGTAPGQYPEEAYNTFEAAINAAKAVNDDEDATQAEVDAAVEALEDAIEEFEDAKIPVEEPSDMPFEIINVTKEGTGDAVVKATIKKKGSYAGDYFVVAQIMDGTTPIITLGAKYSDDEREVVYTFEAKYTVEINIYSKLPEDTDGDGNIDDVGDILAEKVVR